jgi:hypothetical protein
VGFLAADFNAAKQREKRGGKGGVTPDFRPGRRADFLSKIAPQTPKLDYNPLNPIFG